ncbi:expressed protein [Batrachochytrium dendrobatidis JAM81]|uniref:Expressed protein n=1 Tax=Batrachochytrium dendrobatidis (strain JAM81 / FGSC 10211) TaxID=684364 RepID=F4NXC0_BATDJ|nr:uncharacterized protein BATDEDRAFT_36587 [Batrachochytrium dendrobatidis JAM81]EGF82649.1 expressed protein [Batrachochytrium dendrobatidis JAM81]|eukprot:XP_006676838.1 expressed protein [Batrachochytrium dendrobatidis JAM81]
MDWVWNQGKPKSDIGPSLHQSRGNNQDKSQRCSESRTQAHLGSSRLGSSSSGCRCRVRTSSG